MSKKILIPVAILLLGGIFIINDVFSDKKPEVMSSTKIQSESNQLPTSSASPSAGLIVEDIEVGTGKEVKSGDTVIMHYKGTLDDGTKFDSSYDRGNPFETQIGVGRVIKGWDAGVPGMKIGGKRKLTIPPELGYGSTGAGGVIPPNATLIFDVELVGIK